METIPMTIKRHKAYVGALVPFVIYIDNQKCATLANGGEITIQVPNRHSRIRVEMFGNKMQFHAIRAEANIDPSKCAKGHIRCEITTKANPLGIIFPMFARVGNMSISLNYN